MVKLACSCIGSRACRVRLQPLLLAFGVASEGLSPNPERLSGMRGRNRGPPPAMHAMETKVAKEHAFPKSYMYPENPI